jgi:Holliday junction resolvase RusA-like endonuclease
MDLSIREPDFEFEVPGKVQSKQRARIFTNIHGKIRGKTPDETVNYENFIRMCFLKKYRNIVPSPYPLEIIILAYFVKPKNNKHQYPITVKLDVDNIGKIVMDALEEVAYHNDKQVLECFVGKYWGEHESLFVSINRYRKEK